MSSNEKIGLKEKISFAFANMGNIPVTALVNSFLLIFYTNVVGLDPAACATLFLIARILDGVNDPIVGSLPKYQTWPFSRDVNDWKLSVCFELFAFMVWTNDGNRF